MQSAVILKVFKRRLKFKFNKTIMNFKNLILLAGAVAFASACEGPECPEQQLAELSNEGDSNKMAESAEEESNELAEKNCNAVNPRLCASCRGAGTRRATR